MCCPSLHRRDSGLNQKRLQVLCRTARGTGGRIDTAPGAPVSDPVGLKRQAGEDGGGGMRDAGYGFSRAGQSQLAVSDETA